MNTTPTLRPDGRRSPARALGRTRRTLAGLLAAATVLVPASVAAADDDHTALTQSYTSLSAAMINAYATSAGQDLQGYLAAQQVLLVPAATTNPLGQNALPADGKPNQASFGTLDLSAASVGSSQLLTGAAPGILPTGQQATTLNASTLAELNRQLTAAGVGLDTSKVTSLSALATAVTRSSRTLDGAVTLATAKWAQDLGDIRMPKLTSPGVTSPTSPTISASALPFGLLMNKSLTAMVTKYPNLITQAKNSGLGSPAMVQAWNTSMASAYAASSTDLNKMLPNPCVGSMMSVMATGSKASAVGGCSPACVAAGEYLHNSSGALFNSQIGSMVPNTKNPLGGVLNQAALKNMSGWAKGLINQQNPQLTSTQSPFAALNGSSASCGPVVSGGAKSTAKNTLPGVFAGLMK